MNLFDVKVKHIRNGERDFILAGESAESVETAARAAGLDVISVSPHGEDTPPVTTDGGRAYGKSAQGPRRNRDEMEQDRRIEEMAKELGVEDFENWGTADEIETKLVQTKQDAEKNAPAD